MRNRDIINKLIWDVFDLGHDLAVTLAGQDNAVSVLLKEVSEAEAEQIVFGTTREQYLEDTKRRMIARYMESQVEDGPPHQSNQDPQNRLQTVLPNSPQNQNQGG